MLEYEDFHRLLFGPDQPRHAGGMAHRYDLPIFGLTGAADSKLPDEQAAAEAAPRSCWRAWVGPRWRTMWA